MARQKNLLRSYERVSYAPVILLLYPNDGIIIFARLEKRSLPEDQMIPIKKSSVIDWIVYLPPDKLVAELNDGLLWSINPGEIDSVATDWPGFTRIRVESQHSFGQSDEQWEKFATYVIR